MMMSSSVSEEVNQEEWGVLMRDCLSQRVLMGGYIVMKNNRYINGTREYI